MGIGSLLGSDDILEAFVAGTVLSWDLWFNNRVKNAHFQEIIDNLLNLTYFVFIGSFMPWSDFNNPGGEYPELAIWKLILFALWMLFVRRMPIVMLLYRFIPALNDRKEAFFAAVSGCVLNILPIEDLMPSTCAILFVST
jgi:NhaP-type Na+/H+ or K+/H+ antiporter